MQGGRLSSTDGASDASQEVPMPALVLAVLPAVFYLLAGAARTGPAISATLLGSHRPDQPLRRPTWPAASWPCRPG